MSRDYAFDLGEIQLRMVSVSAQDNNCYIVYSPKRREQFIIDAADEAEKIQASLYPDARVQAIITTHSHWDHHRATAELMQATGAPHLAGADDIPDIPVPVTEPLQDGQQLTLLGTSFLIRQLRGHTPGSIALIYHDSSQDQYHIFTGDSLFPGGVGNTDGDPDRFTSLYTDVTQRLFVYPDDTVFYPGHGEHSTLGEERPHLSAWRERGW